MDKDRVDAEVGCDGTCMLSSRSSEAYNEIDVRVELGLLDTHKKGYERPSGTPLLPSKLEWV